MDRAQREEDLMERVAGMGLGWNKIQKALAIGLGIPAAQIGTLETADIVIGGPWPSALLGSKRYCCKSCEGFVSLSPSSQRMLAVRAEIDVLCLRCARKQMSQK